MYRTVKKKKKLVSPDTCYQYCKVRHVAKPSPKRFGNKTVLLRSTTFGREMRCSALFTIIFLLFSKNFINTIFTEILYLLPT